MATERPEQKAFMEAEPRLGYAKHAGPEQALHVQPFVIAAMSLHVRTPFLRLFESSC